jgi:hypothetical protein
VWDDAAGLDIREPLVDLLPNVDVVLDVLERGILRQALQDLPHLVLRFSHD